MAAPSPAKWGGALYRASADGWDPSGSPVHQDGGPTAGQGAAPGRAAGPARACPAVERRAGPEPAWPGTEKVAQPDRDAAAPQASKQAGLRGSDAKDDRPAASLGRPAAVAMAGWDAAAAGGAVWARPAESDCAARHRTEVAGADRRESFPDEVRKAYRRAGPPAEHFGPAVAPLDAAHSAPAGAERSVRGDEARHAPERAEPVWQGADEAALR